VHYIDKEADYSSEQKHLTNDMAPHPLYKAKTVLARAPTRRVQPNGSILIGLVLGVFIIVLLLLLFMLWRKCRAMKRTGSLNE
jgi:hypothetical protein